jgi:methyl-accepting chemotaxis protein
MPELQELPSTISSSTINSEDLRTFARAMLSGDFTARLPKREGDDDAAEATVMLNSFAGWMERMVSELTRLSNEMHDGVFGGQADFVVSISRGPWRSSVEAFNELEWAITAQVRDIAKAARRLAAGRTDYNVTVDCKGEMLELKNSMNRLIEQARTRNQPAPAAR